MQTALVELFGHDEMPWHLLNLWPQDFPNPTVIAAPSTVQRLKSDFPDIKFYNADKRDYHKNNYKSYDLIIFTTWNYKFKNLARFQYLNKSILALHNINLFAEKNISRYSLKLYMKWTRGQCLRQEFKYKKLITKNVKSISVFAYHMLPAARAYFPDKIMPPIFIPYNYINDKKGVCDNLTLGVFGTIKKEFRNYKILEQALHQIAYKQDNIKINFYGEGGNKLKLSLPENINVQYNNLWNYTEYFRHLSTNDILIAPLKVKDRAGVFSEELGITKSSGIYFDAYAAKIPSLVPHDYFKNMGEPEGFYPFNSVEDLVELLERRELSPPIALEKSAKEYLRKILLSLY